MTVNHKAILFFNWFGTGIIMPVMSLMLLSRGCTLQTLSAAIGIYSVTVIVAEVPSGTFADLHGRKTAFLASCAAYMISFITLFFAFGFWSTAAAMLFQGLGRAFSSGSIEALIIEDSIEKSGEASLAKVTSSISVIRSIGIASGAILGGILPDVLNYSIHIAVRVASIITAGIAALLFLRENKRDGKIGTTLLDHLKMSKDLIMSGRTLIAILICICVFSVMLFTLETYWQPAFREIIPEDRQVMLGVICTLGFAATALGGFLMGKSKLNTGRSRWTAYSALAAGMAICLFILAFQRSALGFAAFYALAYLFLGGRFVNRPYKNISAQHNILQGTIWGILFSPNKH